MRCINRKPFYFISIVACFLLVACDNKSITEYGWEGVWERTIHVPKGLQGRCVNEVLTISGKEWHLQAIVHSTFECNQPFLEIFYKGSLDEVKIKKESNDSDLRFQIHDIHLAGIIDVAGSDRAALSESAVRNLSEKYVPQNHQFFEQKSYMSKDNMVMTADVYQPVLDFAIPGYAGPSRQADYKKIIIGQAL